MPTDINQDFATNAGLARRLKNYFGQRKFEMGALAVLALSATIAPAGLTALGGYITAKTFYNNRHRKLGSSSLFNLFAGISALVATPILTIPGSPYSEITFSNRFSAERVAQDMALSHIVEKFKNNPNEMGIKATSTGTFYRTSFLSWGKTPVEFTINAEVIGAPVVDASGSYFSVRYQNTETGEDLYGQDLKYFLRSSRPPTGYEGRMVQDLVP